MPKFSTKSFEMDYKAGIPLGKLPGDIHYKSGKVQVYFPLATSILISILLSLFFWLFKK